MEWGEIPSVCPYVRTSVPPGPPGRPSDPSGRPSDPSDRPSDPSGLPSDPSGRSSDLLAGPLTPKADPQTSPASPQTPLIGFQTPPLDRQPTDGLIHGWMNGQTEFLPILQDFVPCLGRCPATPRDFTTSKKQGKDTAHLMIPFGVFLGRCPKKGQSPVEWGKIPFVHPFVIHAYPHIWPSDPSSWPSDPSSWPTDPSSCPLDPEGQLVMPK